MLVSVVLLPLALLASRATANPLSLQHRDYWCTAVTDPPTSCSGEGTWWCCSIYGLQCVNGKYTVALTCDDTDIPGEKCAMGSADSAADIGVHCETQNA